jgi:hypothetical protein
MTNSAFKTKAAQVASSLVIIICASIASYAQTVVYDWSGNSKTPESYPQIHSTQLVRFRIKKVNNILFSYRLEVTQTPIAGHDFDVLKELTPFGAAESAKFSKTKSACEQEVEKAKGVLDAALEKINGDPKLPPGYAALPKHETVNVDDSIAAWNSTQGVRDDVEKSATKVRNACSGGLDGFEVVYMTYSTAVREIDNLVKGPHEYVDEHELSPGNDVSVTVYELYTGQTVQSKTFSFSGTDVLTLSAGSLFSRIPDRSYEARKEPGQNENFLTVEGNSRFTPAIVALLNYSLGGLYSKLDRENYGLALSAGPVVRFGGKSETSAFGFFTGLSANLYHRFYLTPGIHFGQFADFPAGFQNGSTVPANFGQLDPVKRWTGRFGFAITFKTKDFKGLGSTASVTTEKGAATEASPAPSPSPSPSPSQAPTPSANDKNNSSHGAIVSSADVRNVTRSSATTALIHVSSLNIIDTPRGDRLVISADTGITDYSLYFAEGRMYVVLQHANLDKLESSLRGRLLSNPRVERRGNDLTLSFAIPPRANAKMAEGPLGLDVLVSNEQD